MKGCFEKGIIPHNKGRPHSEWMSEGGLEKYKASRKGRPENFGKYLTGELNARRGRKLTENERLNFKPYWDSLKGRKLSKETINKLRLTSKKHWQNPEIRERQIKAIVKGLIKRPTSLEKQMMGIIKKYNLPYKYTGNGSFLIGFKNPDFVNCNGQKICIEVANTIHHSEDYPQKRIEHFKKYGWDCIVFRTNKLKEDEILEKIRGDFCVG